MDTSAFFAIADRGDQRAEQASLLLQRLMPERSRLFTTNFVAAEFHALMVARLHRNVALSAVQRILQSASITVVRVEAADERRAWEIIERCDDKWFSLTDAISLAVMERIRISTVFSLDDDFRQFGWIIQRPDDVI